MPITSDDIKLLKSQNMDDTPEGGGAMTGVEVIDGASNNIFPDTSTDDRAAGRVNLRKLFGVAHTSDTDTLLGASFVILEPPEDPLVHCTLFETPGWADTRDTARELIERFLAKGPQLGCRLFSSHYAGSTLLRFYSPKPGAGFPAPGDAVCLRNPNGSEQFVRVIRVALSEATYTVSSGGSSSVQVPVNLADCEISVPLAIDFIGPPAALSVNEASYAQVYSTAIAGGARFYGVKPLAAPVVIGDRSVVADGGIYTPLVPAATLEEPVVDVYPLARRLTLANTALAEITLPGVSLLLTAGTVLRLPTAAEPGSVKMQHNQAFTTNAAGDLLQGSTVVGSVDFAQGVISMASGAPNYGTNTNTLTYKPATRTGATAHSAEIKVTQPNQGLSWVYAFEPPPAPGTLSIAYMAQGRWYELLEDGTGKLSGADTSHGTGNLSFVSGSVAFTLGALPDVDSSIVMIWGDASTTRSFNVAQSALPARANALLPLPDQPKAGSMALAWSRGGTNYTATVDGAGVVTGPAQVGPVVRKDAGGYEFTFAPDTLPDGLVAVTYETAIEEASFTNDGGGSYTLTAAPALADSVRFSMVATASGVPPLSVACFSSGSSLFCIKPGGATQLVGTINHATGAIGLTVPSLLIDAYSEVEHWGSNANGDTLYIERVYTPITYTLQRDTILAIGYLPTATAAATPVVIAPAWRLDFKPPVGLELVSSGLAFTWGGDVHWSQDGVLYRGWNALTGAAPVVGAVSSSGIVSLTSAPAGSANAVIVSNLAFDAAHGLDVFFGVFRTTVSPLKAGSFQLQAGARVGNADSGGVVTGDFDGDVDFQRGIVRWSVAGMGPNPSTGTPVSAAALTYNAVYLQYLPLDGTLLGLETARLPLDGKVPIYRAGGQVLVHNTLTTVLPNPITKDVAYGLGRQRIAAVTVRTVDGVKVSATLYQVDFNLGEITFPLASDLTGLAQPFTVHHRIEDELMVLRADISGRLDLIAALTHDYPAGTSFVSSKLRKGDLFARAFNYLEQAAWTGLWSDVLIGSAPTASFNDIDFPIATTNRGAITERWSVIFTGATQVRVVGENVGQILTNVSINAPIAPNNPQTGVPYFSISDLGWGGGWAVGNVLRFNTAACGGPAWTARTVLQGPPSVESDKYILALRADVDRP
jgi:hypothetical protein